MKIFITGCAGSGTTLLRKLFYSFKNVYVIDGQISLKKFISYPTPSKFIIGKRTGPTILSGATQVVSKKQKNMIRKNNIRIINIIRDGRDVLIKRPFKLNPERWLLCISQREIFKNIIDFEISYENLCKNPNSIQNKISKLFGLKKQYDFSDYPNFLPGIETKDINPNGLLHAPRPIDTKSIQKGSEWKQLCTEIEIDLIINKTKELGYVS